MVVIFLEQAELRTKERKELTLNYWRQNVDRLLEFNDRPILKSLGKTSAEKMKRIAHERYDTFDEHRRQAEARAADAEDIKVLEEIEKNGKKKRGDA